jgi:hypothetical protein
LHCAVYRVEQQQQSFKDIAQKNTKRAWHSTPFACTPPPHLVALQGAEPGRMAPAAAQQVVCSSTVLCSRNGMQQ